MKTTHDLESRAKSALDLVERYGVNGAFIDRTALQYGLDQGLFDQKAVDDAEKTYKAYEKCLQHEKRRILDMITKNMALSTVSQYSHPVTRNIYDFTTKRFEKTK